jgi:hypothetical protein
MRGLGRALAVRGTVALAWLATSVGCPLFDSGGVGSGSASVGEDATSDADASASADAADAETTRDAETDGGPSTTTTPLDSTTTSTSASADDGAADASTSTGPDTAESAGSTGGPTASPYANCSREAECVDATQECIQYIAIDEIVAQLCSPTCRTTDDCPAPDTGTALPVCRASDNCLLDCSGGLACPDGMECLQTKLSMRCAYPI